MKPNPLKLILAALALASVSAGKNPGFIISFHEEGQAEEGEKRVQSHVVDGEKRWFRKLPVMTQSNIRAWWPFRAKDGQTWGAAFWLDMGGQHAMQRIAANRGGYLAAAVNRVPVDAVKIDYAPNDGIIVIWKGLTPELFPLFDKQIKRVRDAGATEADAAAAGTQKEKKGFFGRLFSREKKAPVPPAGDPPAALPMPDPAATAPATPGRPGIALPGEPDVLDFNGDTRPLDTPKITPIPEPGQ